ncbi:MAG: branched-chain amino acid ABC transporter permease [Mesorhizobium sp.]|uniref:branched-chain amino acid ABC transporter permease n=1 Tax=Mesorhizobium sp. TaxID=1871066 RepID=UPI000FE6A53E|nr:branched-chain amino acid ABC transporter permease [Mesorhizobium sp.]RWI57109.1 MAG: branched-chain amino acid ABC transporter permease [Mesorhizobium sp.]
MEVVLSALVLGTIYALLAAGIVIVYKASRVVNFAHGELAIVGAYVFYSVSLMLPVDSLFLTIAVTALASALFGFVIYLALMRRLIGEPTFVAAIVTIGLAIVLKSTIVVFWKSRSVGLDITRETLFHFGSRGQVTAMDAITIMVGAAFFALLFYFFHYTPFGRHFRGAAENPLLASQRKVNVNLILSIAWATAVFSAALAGVLFGTRSILTPQSIVIGLSGLTAALVGGLDSLRGALLGGYLVAGASYATATLVDPALSETVPFLLLLIVMTLRPWGLFGTREELDRV